MLYGCDRLGIYFLEKGFRFVHQKFFMIASIPPSPQPAWKKFDFDTIFADADWFHVSGIKPALNEELFLITKTALMKAKEKRLYDEL